MPVNGKKMAVSGLLMALSVVMIVLSGILDFNTLFFLAAAAFCDLARQASSMEPGNPEYSNLVNRLQWNSQRYQGGGSPYANNGGSSCGTGNFCCDLWCADSLCECMGGDLCPCL